jgi:hypothetical protein
MIRNIKTFEAKADVNRMLKRAEKDGIKLVRICNESLREWLTNKGYARKKDLCANEAA